MQSFPDVDVEISANPAFRRRPWLLTFEEPAVELWYLEDLHRRSKANTGALFLFFCCFLVGLGMVPLRSDVHPVMATIMVGATASIGFSLLLQKLNRSWLTPLRSALQSVAWFFFGLFLIMPLLSCLWFEADLKEDPSCDAVQKSARLPFFDNLALAYNTFAMVLLVRVRWFHALTAYIAQHFILYYTLLVFSNATHAAMGQLHLMVICGMIIFACGAFVLDNHQRTGFALRAQLHDRRQAAKASLASMNATMNFVAHEVRSPVHSIHGLLEAVKQELPNMGSQEMDTVLSLLRTHTTTVKRVTDTILDLSQLRADALLPSPVDTDVMGIFQNVTDALSSPPEGTTVSLFMASTVPTLVTVDSQMLKQVLNNVFINAVLATPNGTIDIYVTDRVWPADAQEDGTERHTLLVEVVDSGCGLGNVDPDKVLLEFTPHTSTGATPGGSSPKAVEPAPSTPAASATVPALAGAAAGAGAGAGGGSSRQEDSTTHRRQSQTIGVSSLGLGLPICMHMVKCMSGKLGLLNRPDGASGTKVWMEVPLGATPSPFGPPAAKDGKDGAVPTPHDPSWPRLPSAGTTPPDAASYCRHLLYQPAQREAVAVAKPALGSSLHTSVTVASSAPAASALPANDAAVSLPVVGQPHCFPPSARKHAVVVDNDINCYLTARYLRRLGIIVTSARTGDVVLQVLALHHVDVVFVDVSIPSVRGRAAVNRLHDHPVYKHVPIVAMSAHPDLTSPDSTEYAELGCAGVLPKPFNHADVAKVVSDLFDESRTTST